MRGERQRTPRPMIPTPSRLFPTLPCTPAIALLALAGAAHCGGAGTPRVDGSTPPPGETPPIGAMQQGIATFYDATGAGNCSFDATPGDLRVAAMNTPQYANSAACGTCVAVTGPRGSVTV